MLTEIHRQAAESPIIRMSMDVREGRGLAPGVYGDCLVISRRDIGRDEMAEMVLAADQLLCGMNKTRQTFNGRVRELRGISGGQGFEWLPTAGDKLVCLKNNRIKGLLNGGLWEAMEVHPSGKKLDMRVKSLDDEGAAQVLVETPFQFFLGTEKEMDWRDRKKADEFTFGYALTVHKSQGSQWDNVLLYDESSVFREHAARHLYTAVTRAAETVTVVI